VSLRHVFSSESLALPIALEKKNNADSFLAYPVAVAKVLHLKIWKVPQLHLVWPILLTNIQEAH
jgi:hypothetical protein